MNLRRPATLATIAALAALLAATLPASAVVDPLNFDIADFCPCPPLLPSFDEASGMRFRRVALDGLMLAERKEQSKEESDEANEETYVDTLTSQLRHDTSDIYVPMPGNELALSVKRSITPELWNSNTSGFVGENPTNHVDIDRPFGMCWSSGICASLRVEAYYSTEEGSCPTSQPSTYTYVTDESGASFRFVRTYIVEDLAAVPEGMDVEEALNQGLLRAVYLPLPSNRTEQTAFYNRLVGSPAKTTPPTAPNGFTFTRKFGTELEYEGTATKTISVPLNEENTHWKVTTFYRLKSVKDRFDNVLRYGYDDSAKPAGTPPSLVPDWIEAQAGGGKVRRLVITHANGLISRIQDPSENNWDYTYVNQTIGGINLPFLSEVTNAEGYSTKYIYNNRFTDIPDYAAPRAADDPSPIDIFHHLVLGGIGSNINNKTVWTVFHYNVDEGVMIPALVKNGDIYEVQYYVPTASRTPLVGKVTLGASLPAGFTGVLISDTTAFPATSLFIRQGRITFTATKDMDTGQYSLSVAGDRYMDVTDADGVARRFTYLNPQTIDGKEIENALYRPTTPRAPFYLLAWPGCKVTHPAVGGPAKEETATFNLNAGLADSSVVDYSGNTTSYKYEDAFVFTNLVDVGGLLGQKLNQIPFLNGYYNDPTEEQYKAASGTVLRTTEYAYQGIGVSKGSRVMKSILVRDEQNAVVRTTIYTVDSATGNRETEKIYTGTEDQANLASSKKFEYHPAVKGFLTSTTILNATPADHVTTNVPDMDEHGDIKYGYIASSTTTPGLLTSYEHDANGNQTKITDPNMNVTGFVYDKINRIVTVNLPGGHTKSTVWTPTGKILSQTNERGHTTIHEYDDRNRRVKTTVPGNLVTQFEYTGIGLVRKMTDPRNVITENAYDGLHRLTATAVDTAALNLQTTFSYAGANTGGNAFAHSDFKPILKTNAENYKTQVEYDAFYRPVKTWVEIDGGQAACSEKAYDVFGNVTTSRTWRAKVAMGVTPTGPAQETVTTFDALDRPLTVTVKDRDGVVATTVASLYHAMGGAYRTTTTDTGGAGSITRVTKTQYDGAGRPVKVWQPDPTTGGHDTGTSPMTETVYDDNGNATAVIDPLGHRTDTDYDGRNRPWRVRKPIVDDAEDPENIIAARPTIETQYDGCGNAEVVTNERDAVTTSTFDPANRLTDTQTRYGTGQAISTHLTLDNNGNVLTREDGNGHVTTNTYDALNRLKTTVTNPGGGKPSISVINGYDKVGNLTLVTDGGDRSTSFTYDGLGRKLTTSWVSGTETLIHDALLQTGRVAPSNLQTSYIHDGRDRLENVIYSTTGAATSHHLDNQHRTYDALGRILTVTYPNDPSSLRDVAFTYDILGRILTETSGGVLHTYADYDKAGNRHKTTYGITGRHLVSTYDALNRLETLTEKNIESDLTGRVTTYHYDLAGNVTRKVLPNQNHIDTRRDRFGRTLRIEEWTSTDVLISASDYSTPVGTWPSGYDAVGNVLRVDETYSIGGMAGRTVINTYDNTNRLLTETITSGGNPPVVTTYGYDGSNNRTTKVVGTVSTTYVFGTSNQLTSYGPTGGNATVTFTHDANGNRETRTEGTRIDTYTWDPENRLITLGFRTASATSGPDYRYAYDYRSRRVVRDESGAGGIKTALSFSGGTSVQEYQIREITDQLADADSDDVTNYDEFIASSDPLGGSGGTFPPSFPVSNYAEWAAASISLRSTAAQIIAYRDASRTLKTETIRGSDWGGGVGGILYTITPDTSGPVRSYNAYNSRGDVVSTTGAAGTATWQASYEAFGTRTAEQGDNAARQRANTKDEDPTGLLNEGMRYRDLAAGVFISRDPAGFVDGPNVYTYVRQNPWTKFDPLGLESEWHHRYSQKHREKFTEMDIDIDAPENGVALDRKDHARIHKKDGFIPGTGKEQYGKEWDNFFDNLADEEATNGPLDKSARKQRAENFLQELEGQDRFKTPLAKRAQLPDGMSYSEYSKLTKQQKGAFYKTVWGSKKTGQAVSFAGKAGAGLKFVAKKAGPLGAAVSIVTFGATASAEGADAASQELLMDLTGASIVKMGADVVEEKLNGVIYQTGGQHSELRRMLEEEEP